MCADSYVALVKIAACFFAFLTGVGGLYVIYSLKGNEDD